MTFLSVPNDEWKWRSLIYRNELTGSARDLRFGRKVNPGLVTVLVENRLARTSAVGA